MERISSRQNAVVKRFRDLARASRPGGGGARGNPDDVQPVLLDGEHLVQEALACDIPVEIAAFADTRLSAARSPLGQIAQDIQARGGRVLTVSEQVLTAMSPVQNPSGVVAIGFARPAPVRVAMSAGAGAALVVVLAGLQDPGNTGAIVRAAAAFGASGIVATEGTADPFGWKALRGAMGGTFRIPVAARSRVDDVVAVADEFGVQLVAAVPRGGTPLTALDLRVPTALVLGGEGAGVAPEIANAVRHTVTIPMSAPVESLNVAVAAAVILYEAMRQRGT